MAQAFVPDFDPTRKQKPLEPAPWSSIDSLPTSKSTYSSAYTEHPYVARKSFKPDSGFDWSALRTQSTVFRSTMQDAYPTPFAFSQPPNQKPKREFKSTPWMQPLTTTSQSSFISYPYAVRTKPVMPKAQREVQLEPGFESFTGRATSADAYRPPPSYIKRTMPIIPSEKSAPIPSQDGVHFTTTQSSSYVPHMVTPYKKAPKPQSSYSGIGNH